MADMENGVISPEELPKAQSRTKAFIKKFLKRKAAVISLAFILVILFMGILAPYIVPYDAATPDYTALLQGPSPEHWWGTDEFGRDVFSRLMVGTRLSVFTALAAVTIGTIIGVDKNKEGYTEMKLSAGAHLTQLYNVEVFTGKGAKAK